MKIFAETERLILREILPEDENGLFQLDSDPDVHQYLGNKTIHKLEEARDAITRIRQQYIDNGIGRWAIVEKSTNSFIGWTGLKLMKELTNNHIEHYDMGYRIMKKYWGKGIATETVRPSLAYGFDILNQDNIFAMAHIGNLASGRVLEKSGFKLIETFELNGVAKNWFKITREEWATEKSRTSR
jgi:RimJ/RimL family protein N-acetyltransferase